MKIQELYSNVEVFASVGKNDRGEVIQVVKGTATKGKKEERIDVRTYYTQDGELHIGKGVAIPVEHAEEVAVAMLVALGKVVSVQDPENI